MEKGWIGVYLTAVEYRAEIAKQLLFESGIEAVVVNRKDSTYNTFGELEVYVQEQHQDHALQILNELKKGEN